MAGIPHMTHLRSTTLAGLSSVVLLFNNQRGTHTAEYMELDSAGKIIRVVANYSG